MWRGAAYHRFTCWFPNCLLGVFQCNPQSGLWIFPLYTWFYVLNKTCCESTYPLFDTSFNPTISSHFCHEIEILLHSFQYGAWAWVGGCVSRGDDPPEQRGLLGCTDERPAARFQTVTFSTLSRLQGVELCLPSKSVFPWRKRARDVVVWGGDTESIIDGRLIGWVTGPTD